MQPNSRIPNKIANNAYADSQEIFHLREKHLKKQLVEKKEKEKEKKVKKSKKDKNKKSAVHEDRIRVNQEPAPRNVPPKHEYQNIIEEQQRLVQIGNERKFGDTEKLYEKKKTRCAIQDGVYVFHNISSVGSSLTSFAEIENHKKVSQDIDNGSGKLKNFNLSKYLNIDVKSASRDKTSADKQDNSCSSKSSSLSNKSIDSMERNIILNGLKNSEDETNSYLGPFNFRKLLKPTRMAPTESLRKRKMITSSPPPDKNLKTNGLF
jgi:hypothetical protein